MIKPRRFIWLAVLILAATLLGYLTTRLVAFFNIFGEHAGMALTQPEVQAAHDLNDTRAQVVPKIIHQIFHNWIHPGNETLPSDWDKVRQTIIALNPDYELKLWHELPSRDFIKIEYPWFLSTYDGFKYPVQRIDTLRYFLMRHYGGIYMDLDNGCQTSLDSLLYYPAWITDGGQGALSNNILGAVPNHPFWVMFTDNIMLYAHNYILPYVTVSYATGQWFETIMWEKYHAEKDMDAPLLLRVMMDGRENGDPVTIFTSGRGGSWHTWDNEMFMLIGSPILLTMLCVGAAVFVIGLVTFVIIRRRHTKGYERIDQHYELNTIE